MRISDWSSDVCSSDLKPLPEQDPLVVQNGFWLLNGSVRVFSEDGKWEFAVIGRNLTNVNRAVESASGSFTGSGALTGTSTLGGRPDYTGNLMSPRSVMAQEIGRAHV